MSKNRNGLGIIEYGSVLGSVLGSAIAVITQQMIYGLAPVSLSLLLNLINRRRLEPLCQQSSSDSTQLQQLRSAIDSVSAANAKLEQDVQNLVPIQQLTSVVSSVEQLSQQYNGLRLSLVPLQSRLDDLIEQFNKRPELEQIESLTAVITALKQCIDNLPQPERLENHSAKFQQQVELALVQLSEKTTQLSQNSQRVERLEDAIAQLQQQLFERY